MSDIVGAVLAVTWVHLPAEMLFVRDCGHYIEISLDSGLPMNLFGGHCGGCVIQAESLKLAEAHL